MFVGDLVHFRAALSNGITHDMILCPSTATTPATSAANTPDNRSLASEKKKKRFSSFFSRPRPAVKAANVGAGMKLPMNIRLQWTLSYQQETTTNFVLLN
ncbi:hypothetical protein GGI42DRAFT_353770 [Trichoderma sp. SZMC 28013]